MRPVPKARPRLGRNNHTFTPKSTSDAEKQIASVAKCYLARPFSVPVLIIVDFIYAAPKSWPRKKLLLLGSSLIPRDGRPDIDNLYKLVADALNGIAYEDDAQIVKITSGKFYGNEDGVHISIIPILEA
jgi:Holliday junction resolvase RusA-like endonuclease